jgi:predicted ribosome quality control (RQC) complex YloA/Tae2 family protein
MKENEVKKLHNRIALLKHEEEKALKRIEETREKANIMLENKIHQE